ncbi:hypothetical protein CBR_g3390 [Chara braunii]|uniref:Uncharacterized protein n=1 Tax=Chara braunii TaxID=69332 RepID=A0A388JQU3_CHABU|nr:hypothetical protein CBR_g3390 [Chara braunii]|eukprot:GBG60147.1 hypothetical protein CBR_g3390 [Chara braunii]
MATTWECFAMFSWLVFNAKPSRNHGACREERGSEKRRKYRNHLAQHQPKQEPWGRSRGTSEREAEGNIVTVCPNVFVIRSLRPRHLRHVPRHDDNGNVDEDDHDVDYDADDDDDDDDEDGGGVDDYDDVDDDDDDDVDDVVDDDEDDDDDDEDDDDDDDDDDGSRRRFYMKNVYGSKGNVVASAKGAVLDMCLFEGFGAGAANTPFYNDLRRQGGFVLGREFFDLLEDKDIALEVSPDLELSMPLQLCGGCESSGAAGEGGYLGSDEATHVQRKDSRGQLPRGRALMGAQAEAEAKPDWKAEAGGGVGRRRALMGAQAEAEVDWEAEAGGGGDRRRQAKTVGDRRRRDWEADWDWEADPEPRRNNLRSLHYSMGTSAEKWGEAGRSGEKRGEVGRSGEKRGEVARSWEKWGGAGRSGEKRGEVGRSRQKWEEEE